MNKLEKPCVFCEIIAGRVPAAVVSRTEHSLAMLDHRPLYPGHVLVVPLEHHSTLMDLPDAAMGGFFADVKRIARAVEYATAADGIFDAINNRMSQSVPHLHIHVVPRRHKDDMRYFMWPRHKYADDAAAEAMRARIAEAVDMLREDGDEAWTKMRQFVVELKQLPKTIGGEDSRETLEKFARELRSGVDDLRALASMENVAEFILADPELSARFVKERMGWK